MNSLVGLLLMLFGVWFFFSPDSAFAVRKSWDKKWGVQTSGGKKALASYKIFGILLFIVGGIFLLKLSMPPAVTGVCTMDAKICADGSAVGRVPPDCDFAPCPSEIPLKK
jgi:hypothetical protein